MNEQAQNKELTIHLEGGFSDEGNVQLGAYAKKLDELRLLYIEAQLCLDGAEDKDDLLITNLTHNSPTATTLRPTGINGVNALDFIVDSIKKLNARCFILAENKLPFFEKLSNFCKTNFNQFSKIWFSSNNKILTAVTLETVVFIDSLLVPGYTSIGSVKGKVKKYDSHVDKKYFIIYPLVGGKVKCKFNESQVDEAKKAVENNIIVYGLLKYYGGHFFPYEIDMTSIEIIPNDECLPKLSEMLIEHNDHNFDSVQTIKRIRNEW